MMGNVGVFVRFVQEHAHSAVSDEELLRRFQGQRDQSAFSELVRRHGAMVLGVCRRVLRDGHEAEDAFQATFLVLARKAESLRNPNRLGPWLFGVASRVSRKARRRVLRHPVPLASDFDRSAPSQVADVQELLPALDEAILSLPSRYREPIVLCYLGGLTNSEAAMQLGCPLGTIATRLARAREQLRMRLVRRGIGLSAVAFPTVLTQAIAAPDVPSLLVEATAESLGRPVTAGVAKLMEGIGVNMILEKSRWLIGSALLLGIAIGGAGWLSYSADAQEPRPTAPMPVPAPPIIMAMEEEKPAVIETPNFVVEGTTPRLARLLSEAAERHRKEKAIEWLGKELPNWDKPCRITVKMDVHHSANSGGTSFNTADRWLPQHMKLEGSLDRLLADTLPHEVTHTVIWGHFGKPVPRWADEGIALMSESPEEQMRYHVMAQNAVTGKRNIPLPKLVGMQEYPQADEIGVFYSQVFSFTSFLVAQKDRATLIAFIKDGTTDDWNKAAQKHYGFARIATMEEPWKVYVAKMAHGITKETADIKGPALANSPMPEMALAVAEKGQIAIARPMPTIENITSYVPTNGGNYQQVTSYGIKYKTDRTTFSLSELKASELNGEAIDAKSLLERLKIETHVILKFGDDAVDPFYLKLIKPGTIVINAKPKYPQPQPAQMPIMPNPITEPRPSTPSPAVPAQPGAAPEPVALSKELKDNRMSLGRGTRQDQPLDE